MILSNAIRTLRTRSASSVSHKKVEKVFEDYILQIAEEDTAVNQEDVISSISENWLLLSDAERRQFLLQFVETIKIVNVINEGKQFGDVKIADVTFRGI